jgi:hypothetical protein
VRARTLLAAVALVALSAAGPARAGGGGPALRLTGKAPVAVAGSGFARGARVHVVLHGADGRRSRHARATARGSFAVRFVHASLDRCSPWRIVATDAAGDRVVLRSRALPQCAPA